jgi:uncharacterized protein (UPF0147 family)
LALAHDPSATCGKVLAGVVHDLAGKERRSVARALVADRLADPDTWPEYVSRWHDRSLAREAERMLRDRLSGSETPPAARIKAAVALSKIAPALEPAAVEELEKLSRGRIATRRARKELALLDPRWRERVLADARAILADAERPERDRVEAGSVIADITSELPGECRRQMEDLVADGRITGRLRLRIVFHLGRLDDLRALRDDRREPLPLRDEAASALSDYSRADRVAAVELFLAIVADTTCHAMLRARAARELAKRGTRGHELGTAALETLMRDETLPLSARRDAAHRLGRSRPDLRGEVLNVLRGFLQEGNPLARVQTWKVIGAFQPEEAARGLLCMARNHSLGPVVRCRSAWTAARLHRDHREAAAVVAREIAHDDTAPRHVRISAARLLALVSDLCREEGRQLIKRLDVTPPGRTGAGTRSG